MSIADYNQRAEDHQCLLVLVKPIIQLKTKLYSRIIDRATSVTYIQLPDSKRSLWLRYKQHMHLENNDWGEFQVGTCSSSPDEVILESRHMHGLLSSLNNHGQRAKTPASFALSGFILPANAMRYEC